MSPHRKPIDILDLGPSRSHLKLPDGRWMVSVQPPSWIGVHTAKCVTLTAEQYIRYSDWLSGSKLIQEALPDLSAEDREILLNGDPS